MIDIVRDAGNSLAGHLNELRADVDALHHIAETREVFAQPARTASDIQNPASGRPVASGARSAAIFERTWSSVVALIPIERSSVVTLSIKSSPARPLMTREINAR